MERQYGGQLGRSHEESITKDMIIASQISMHTSNDTVGIMFGNPNSSFAEYVVLQRTIDASECDKELGLDKIYIEYCDQVRSAYGGMLEIRVYNRQIELVLDKDTASVLRTGEVIVIQLQSVDINPEKIKQTLFKLVDGCANVALTTLNTD